MSSTMITGRPMAASDTPRKEARLADQGHVQAAQLAWWMHRHGALLYGSDWYASQAQQRAWAAQLPSPSPQPSDDSRD